MSIFITLAAQWQLKCCHTVTEALLVPQASWQPVRSKGAKGGGNGILRLLVIMDESQTPSLDSALNPFHTTPDTDLPFVPGLQLCTDCVEDAQTGSCVRCLTKEPSTESLVKSTHTLCASDVRPHRQLPSQDKQASHAMGCREISWMEIAWRTESH